VKGVRGPGVSSDFLTRGLPSFRAWVSSSCDKGELGAAGITGGGDGGGTMRRSAECAWWMESSSSRSKRGRANVTGVGQRGISGTNASECTPGDLGEEL
jgi:hypothetical protein